MKNTKSSPSAAFQKINLLVSALVLLQACAAADGTAGLDSGDPRVTWQNTPVNLVGGSGLITLGTLLTLSATVNPPSGQYADDVFVKGTNAYVSYNTPGATAAGSIDQISISSSTLPVRTATFSSPAADINGVYVDTSNTVYAIGADGVNGSVMKQLTVSSSAFSAVSSTLMLPSYAGTGVKVWNSKLYTLTGDAGGLNVFPLGSQSSTATPTTAITDARGMDQAGSSNLWVVAGGGNVYEMTSAGAIQNTLTFTGANNIPQSKSAVHVGNSLAAVSLGSQGAALICMADHQVVTTIAPPTVSGIAPSLTVTNSVTYGDGLLFVANGEAGVYAYTLTNPLLGSLVGAIVGTTTACGALAVTYQGYIDLGRTSHYSANNVYYSNGTLYVATGAGGFKIITVNFSVLGLVVGLLGSI